MRPYLAMVLAFLATTELHASPLITPFATKLVISYEGGYRLRLEVCGELLCTLELVTPKQRFTVPRAQLAMVDNPDVTKAQMFLDPSGIKPHQFSVYVPLADFDRKYYPAQKLIVFTFFDDGRTVIKDEVHSASN